MADNSRDSQRPGAATPTSATKSIDRTDLQVKGSGSASASIPSSAEPDAESTTRAAVTTTAAAHTPPSPPLPPQARASTPRSLEGPTADESPLWDYPSNRIFLTERLDAEGRRKPCGEEEGEGGEEETRSICSQGDVKTGGEARGEDVSQIQNDKEWDQLFGADGTLLSSKEAHLHNDKQKEGKDFGETFSEQGLRETQSSLSGTDTDTDSEKAGQRESTTPYLNGETKSEISETNKGIAYNVASSHTRVSTTSEENAAGDYPEHVESIPFTVTIFLQTQRPSKQEQQEKQSITSEERPKSCPEMETRHSANTLASQADVQDSIDEKHKDEHAKPQTADGEPLQPDNDANRNNSDSKNGQETHESENGDDKTRPASQQQHHHSGLARSQSRGSRLSMDRTRTDIFQNGEDVGGVSQNADRDDLSQHHQEGKETGDRTSPSPSDEAEEGTQAEYGSPTKPKPPTAPFQKPSPPRMAELDRHVLMTPKQLSKYPLFELAQYLMNATRTEVETAYVIFRWVTCQIPKQRQTTPRGEEEEEEMEKKDEEKDGEETGVPTLVTYVKQLNNGSIGHADLFSMVCKCVNLETHKVEGRLRYYRPQPSPQLVRTRPSSWSALLLPGGWGIVDCGLGARYWASECARRTSMQRARLKQPRAEQAVHRERKGAVTRAPDSLPSGGGEGRPAERAESGPLRACQEYSPQNFYFLPPPQLLVTSHLPDNPCWQLLPHPVAETDFLTSLLLKPHLHYLGVDLVSPSSLRLTEIPEELDVTWRLKGEGLRRFAFRFFSLSDGASAHQELTRHGFLENQHSRGAVGLRLSPPTSGRHVCELYGTYVPTRGNEMIHLCSFDLDFVKTTSTALKFPHNDRVEWGPGAECVALGMTPSSHVSGCVNVDKGEAELVFTISKPVLVTQKLFSAADEGQGAEILHSTVNFRDSKNRVKILLRIPDPGDYVLSLYAKEESSSGKCQLVCNYLVLCDSGTSEVVHPFPSLPFNKLGPTKAFFDLNMKLVCPKRSCIVVAPYSGKVTFVFGSPEDTELSCDLLHQGVGVEELADSGDYVQHTYQAGESVFRARLPLAGDYIFHLYGKPSDGEGHKFLLYTALIECAVPNKDCLPLPKVVSDWRSRVQILAPLRKCLVVGAVAHFAVRAYKVKAVAIVSQSGVQNFENEDEEEEEEEEEEGKDHDDDDDNEDNAERQEPDEQVSERTLENDEESRKHKDQDFFDDVNGSEETPALETETANENDQDGINRNDEADEESKPLEDSSALHRSDESDLPPSRATSAIKTMSVKQEDEAEDDEEREDEWQVWRCKVKVSTEDEGSGVKLCVRASSPQDSHLICVAEFEVISERNMTAKLEHQHALWAAAADSFKVRPDSGHRSHLDDEERQSAYFLDDEVYLSNPLGDDLSDTDDSDNFSQDDDDHSSTDVTSEDDADSDVEDNATGGSGTAKRDGKTVATQDSSSKSPRRHPASDKKPDKGDPAPKQGAVPTRKVKSDRGAAQAKRTYHASAIYNAPQPCSSIRETRQRAAAQKQKEKMASRSDARQGERGKRPGQDQRQRETDKQDKLWPQGTGGSREKSEIPVTSYRINKKVKTADGAAVRQDSGTRERTLRRKLWKACQRREREAIKKAVKSYTRRDLPPCADLTAAERLLHLFKLQDALVEALASKDLETIRHALTEVERHGFAGEMSVECRKAHAMLSPHRNYGRLPETQVETDMRTLMEIRSYRCPPGVVHHVIVATLLLLGVHEGLTKTWKKCRRRLQVLCRKGMLKKMVKIRVDTIHPEIAARARVLLAKQGREEAHSAGPGVKAVYTWANSVLSRVENLSELDEAYTGDSANTPPQPASRRRQREIFRQQITGTATTSTSTTTTTTTSTTTKTTTTTTSTAPSSSKHPGSEVSKTRGGKWAGSDTPRNKSNSKPTREADRTPGAVRKEPGNQPGKEGTRRAAGGRQNAQTDAKRNGQTADTGKPSTGAAPKKSHPTLNSKSNNVLKPTSSQDKPSTNARKGQPTKSDDPRTQHPGHYPRPKPVLQNARKENAERNPDSAAGSIQNRPPPANRSASHRTPAATPRDSPERSAKAGTASIKPGEDATRAQQTARPPAPRHDHPQDQLRCLSPRKSPLFRPANRPKNRTDTARPRPAHRPKTTPTPVLQSTFFFASLVGKEEAEDGEVNNNNNNNIPLSFTNYSNGTGGFRASQTAGGDNRAGATTETRIGQRAGQRFSAHGRRSVSDITTPDI